jgi:hypothetical protein
MAQVWIADEVIPNSQGFNDTNTTFGAPQGLEAGRTYSRGKWNLSECLILVACKQIDFFVYTDSNNQRTLMTQVQIQGEQRRIATTHFLAVEFYCIFIYMTPLSIHGHQGLIIWSSYDFLRAKKQRLCLNFQRKMKMTEFHTFAFN